MIYIEQDLMIRSDSVHLMMDIIFLYLSPVLLSIFWIKEHSLQTLPEIENMQYLSQTLNFYYMEILRKEILSELFQKYFEIQCVKLS